MISEAPLLTSKSFFSSKQNLTGALWLPCLSTSGFTRSLDWQLGLQLSKQQELGSPKWSSDLKNTIKTYHIPFEESATPSPVTLIKLPSGFKCTWAIVVEKLNWLELAPKELIENYNPHMKGLNVSFIQAPLLWKGQALSSLPQNIQWVRP